MALGYRQFYKDLPEKCFSNFSDFFRHIKKSRVFLEISLVVVNHRPFKWLRDIFLGREICSQSRGISFSKIDKIENC